MRPIDIRNHFIAKLSNVTLPIGVAILGAILSKLIQHLLVANILTEEQVRDILE